jgi:hypothetical protein
MFGLEAVFLCMKKQHAFLPFNEYCIRKGQDTGRNWMTYSEYKNVIYCFFTFVLYGIVFISNSNRSLYR